MLISFSLENWMSFCDPVSFSMLASQERQHGDRLFKPGKYKTRILPIAAIYGANASGKSNFFKALRFVKNFVVNGTQPDSHIPVDPFLLDKTSREKASRFKLELLVEEMIYELSFALTQQTVQEEKLVRITQYSEQILYHRKEGQPHFHSSLDEQQFLNFAFQGTRENQLFLTNAVSQKVDTFKPVYDWFKERLVLIDPETLFPHVGSFIDEKSQLYRALNEWFPKLDTGIVRFGGESIPFEKIPFPNQFKDEIRKKLKEGESFHYIQTKSKERFVIERKNAALVAKKLHSYHRTTEGEECKFEIEQESDGTQRLFDLLPAFGGISNTKFTAVCVIDEMDRSLHPLLSRQLLEYYLASCNSESRSQILLSTHDVSLMDQDLFRRDEMWLAESDAQGRSNLLSFNDYKDVRYDKDIRKSYLQGRYGAVPRILLDSSEA